MDAKLRLSITSLGASAAFVAVLAVACGADRTATEEHRFGGDASPGTEACQYRCSPDLKTVLGACDGGAEAPVATCGPDEGCGVDRCVDACQAAALSKGSVGCSFWTLPPDDGTLTESCFVAMIANTWDRPVALKAGLGAEPLDISSSVYTATVEGKSPVYRPLKGPIPPGAVALVFLSQGKHVPTQESGKRCPTGIVPAFDGDPIRHGTVKTRAFHIETDAPVSAYSIFPYGGAESHFPSATLLLPVSSWDKDYVAVSTGRFGTGELEQELHRRTVQIVAHEDGTEITMRPTEAILEGDGVAPTAAGVPTKWTLARGDVVQITQLPLLTGSPISSNKPFGLFGGSPCIDLPNGSPACDVTQQQIAPFAQWGSEYALVPFKPRTHGVTMATPEQVPWLLVGAVAGTELTYDPAQPLGAPSKLAAGEVANFTTEARVTVKSQDTKHPFYAAVHMTGGTWGGGAANGNILAGDPDFVTVVPSDQFLDRYVFFADYTFPDTTVVVVRHKTPAGFRPVDLDCAGELTGFMPLGKKGEYEYTFVDLTKGAVPQPFARGQCGYGRHEATSEGPFSVTVWGIGEWASYGYAGGAGSRPINAARPPILE